MKQPIVIPLVAAVIGGALTAGVLVGTGAAGGETTTVIQQAPLSAAGGTRDADTGGGALTPREIYKRDAPGVVFIRARAVQQSASVFDPFGSPQESESTGTGFVIDDEGYIITNAHVVNAATDVEVQFSDKTRRGARIVGQDLSTDLALLKADPKGLDLRPLAFGDSDAVQVGDPTIAIGNPFGLDRTLTTGVVSALQREIRAPDNYTIEDVIQTDAAINPGNSGGPLLDAAGRVIGVNSQIVSGSNGNVGIGFAVPSNTVRKVIPDLKEKGRVERAYMGVDFIPVADLEGLGLEAKSGLLVQAVEAGGPADRAGLRGGTGVGEVGGQEVRLGGDVIQKVDGRAVKTTDDIRAVLDEHDPGDEVAVEYRRDGKTLTAKLKLADRPPGRPVG